MAKTSLLPKSILSTLVCGQCTQKSLESTASKEAHISFPLLLVVPLAQKTKQEVDSQILWRLFFFDGKLKSKFKLLLIIDVPCTWA